MNRASANCDICSGKRKGFTYAHYSDFSKYRHNVVTVASTDTWNIFIKFNSCSVFSSSTMSLLSPTKPRCLQERVFVTLGQIIAIKCFPPTYIYDETGVHLPLTIAVSDQKPPNDLDELKNDKWFKAKVSLCGIPDEMCAELLHATASPEGYCCKKNMSNSTANPLFNNEKRQVTYQRPWGYGCFFHSENHTKSETISKWDNIQYPPLCPRLNYLISF